MKKTVNVAIGGCSFIIDEDAYIALDNYLDRFRTAMNDSAGGDDVMEELESRIADLMKQKLVSRDDRQSARAYFDQGLYENRIACSLDKDGSSFKVGIRAGNMPTSYWCCFDNFRLYFYGNIDIDAVTDIDGIVSEKTATIRKGIYSLDGRLLSNDNADAVLLDKGIYIINGKKVIISK